MNSTERFCQLNIHTGNETRDVYQKWFRWTNSNFCWQNLNSEVPQKFIHGMLLTKSRAWNAFFNTKFELFFMTNSLHSSGIVSMSNRIIWCSVLTSELTRHGDAEVSVSFIFLVPQLLLTALRTTLLRRTNKCFSNVFMSSLYNFYRLILVASVSSSAWSMKTIY